MVVAQSIAGQFFTVYQLQYLGLNYTSFQLLNAVASLGSLASMPLWGYLADKYGNKPILIICCGLVLVPPLLWILAAPDGIAGLWGHDGGGASAALAVQIRRDRAERLRRGRLGGRGADAVQPDDRGRAFGQADGLRQRHRGRLGACRRHCAACGRRDYGGLDLVPLLLGLLAEQLPRAVPAVRRPERGGHAARRPD